MNRMDAMRVIVEQTEDLPLIATLAATSRELAAIADRPNHLYLLDAMGLTSSVALGVALALDGTPVPRAACIDGDGSLLMNLGSLATNGFLRAEKLVLVVLDNGVYASTADIPTAAERLDLGAVATACGLRVLTASDTDRLAAGLADALVGPGPVMLHVRIDPGNTPGTPLLLMDPVVLGARFAAWLASVGGRSA